MDRQSGVSLLLDVDADVFQLRMIRFGRRCEKPLFDQSRGLTDPALWSRDYLISALRSIAGPIIGPVG